MEEGGESGGEMGDIALTPEETCQFVDWWMTYPALWDPDHKLYKDRAHKRDNRKVLVELMRTAFGRSWTEGQVHRKICSLKGQYNNQKRKNELLSLYPSIAGGKKPKVWTHFEQMRVFLEKADEAAVADHAAWKSGYCDDAITSAKFQRLDKVSHRLAATAAAESPETTTCVVKEEIKRATSTSPPSARHSLRPAASSPLAAHHQYSHSIHSSSPSSSSPSSAAASSLSFSSSSYPASILFQLSSLRSQAVAAAAAAGQQTAATAQMVSPLLMQQHAQLQSPMMFSAGAHLSPPMSGARKRPRTSDELSSHLTSSHPTPSSTLASTSDGGGGCPDGGGGGYGGPSVAKNSAVHSTSSPTSSDYADFGHTESGYCPLPAWSQHQNHHVRLRNDNANACTNSDRVTSAGVSAATSRSFIHSNKANSSNTAISSNKTLRPPSRDGDINSSSCVVDDRRIYDISDDECDDKNDAIDMSDNARRRKEHRNYHNGSRDDYDDDNADEGGGGSDDDDDNDSGLRVRDSETGRLAQADKPTALQHQTYGLYVAERLACIRSKKTVLCLQAKIDKLLHDALLEEVSD